MSQKEFYDRCPLGICVVKHDRRDLQVLYANEAYARLMRIHDEYDGYKLEITVNDLIGRPLVKAWPSNDIEDLVKRLKSTTPPEDYTLPVFSGSSDFKRWAKLTITSEEFEGQSCYVLWATDISSSKEAEARLERAVEDADAMAEMKANFLATMSHEIRTPMQTIYGLLELIADEDPSENIRSMLNTAITSASAMLEILNDVLDLAKMDANKMELDMFEVPVRTLVSGTLEALEVRTAGKTVTLIDDIDDDVPPVVLGDPKRLRQILMNLIGNALKFTDDGFVTVKVRQDPHPRQSQNPKFLVLRFEVVDTGIGMSEDIQARLFQNFSQADNSTSRKYGGTGLGLSISKKLVELMGGKIGVNSAEGEGSTFWFEIPTEIIDKDNTVIDLPDLTGLSILSVDDHPQGSREIQRSLESMGAIVESTNNYAEAFDLMNRRPFDVAVIDQGLPDGLGIDLVRKVIKIRPFMGIIMYTVRDDIGLQHSCAKLGIEYLAKPASRLGLGEAVLDATSKASRFSLSGPRKLLIAEDTPSVQDVFRRQLSKLDIDADIVRNGSEALAAYKTGNYGIMITDLHMPEVDGYGVIRYIRRQEAKSGTETRPFPVIVLTADVQMAQRQTYLEHGFDECLLKPVSLGQLQRLFIRWGLLEDEHSPSKDDPENPAAAKKEAEKVQKAKDADKLPAVDLESLEIQMGGLDEDSLEMLQMFVDMSESLIRKIRNAYENKDYHALRDAAHSLKGGARTACCNILGEYAAQLQEEAPLKSDACNDLVSSIENEYKRAAAEISKMQI